MKKPTDATKPEIPAEENLELIKLKEQLETTTNQWKRALADYQNLEKRVRDEKQEFLKFSAKGVIEKLLGVLDDLEKAQVHLKDQGLGLALKKLRDLLVEEGVEKLETVGKEYDVTSMEAIALVDGEDNKVVEEFRPGYTMYGSILRAAQVKVSQKKQNENKNKS